MTPVGELVAPKAPADQPPESPASTAGPSGRKGPMKAAAADGSANGMGIALSIAAGLVILLATGWFLVNRRWPLPDLARHFRR